MNIQLNNTEEFVDGKSTGSLGQVMIRSGPPLSSSFQLELTFVGCG